MKTYEDVVDFLEHYGVKGMKWGKRKDIRISRAEQKPARQEVKAVSKSARTAIKMHRKATTNAERKKAQKMYKKEVVDKMMSKSFKKAYADSHKITTGQAIVNNVLLGPIGAMSINAASRQAIKYGANRELATARQVLKEMQT